MPGIFIEIIGNATQFKRELDSAARSTQRFGAVTKIAGGLLATGLVIGLEKSVKAAVEAEQSTAKLNQAFTNAGLSASDYSKQIDAAEESNRKLGFTDHETESSLGSLVTATHDVGAATRDMGVAIDVARFKHIDLEAATKTLTMAMAGSKRALTALGVPLIAVKTNVDELKRSNMDLSTEEGKAALAHAQLLDKMATGQAIIQATSDRIHGQGQAYADTAAGGMAQFNAQLNHLEVEIGTVLIPTLTRLLGKVTEFVTALNTSLGPAVKQTSAAMSHLGFVADAVAFIFKYSANIYNVLKVELMALNLAIRAGTAAYDALRSAAVAVGNAFEAVKNAAVSVASAVRGGLVTAFNAFKGVASGVMGVVNAIANALRAVAEAARAVASALSSIHVPHLSIPGAGLLGKIPHPHLASGGIVTRPTLALIGEAGPEAVVPLGKGYGTGGGMTVNVYVAGSVTSEQNLAETIRRNLLRTQGRNGSLGFT